MNETALYLVDNVIGPVPVRHWICTVPPPLRYLLAYDADLCSAVLDAFVRSIFAWLRHTAKKELGLTSARHAHPAATTVIHRASSNLALNVHFHTLVADGVYVRRKPEESPTFCALPAPSNGDVTAIAWQTCTQTLAHLRKRGLLTTAEMAVALGVTTKTVNIWYRHSLLNGYDYNDKGGRLYELPPPGQRPRKQQGQHGKLAGRGALMPHATHQVQST